jgi:hypothetical protein
MNKIGILLLINKLIFNKIGFLLLIRKSKMIFFLLFIASSSVVNMFSGNPIGKQVFVLGQMAKLTDLYK